MEKERFSLLLLEPGEYYFEDYSVYLSCDHNDLYKKDLSNELIGRLKICSKSLVFDPRNVSKPLIKIPLKECTDIKKINKRLFSESYEILLIECNLYIEMLSRNILEPYSFKYDKKLFYILFNYARVDDSIPYINQLRRASSLPVAEQNQMIAAIAYDRQCRMKFDIMWLESFDEKIIMETIGSKITPLVVNPGKIILSNLNLYFQPFNNIEPHQYIKIRLSLIKTIIRRRFLLQHVGLEIYCEESNSISHLYLSLKSSEARDGLYDTILKQPELHLFDSKQEIMTLQWQNGTISNFEYLLYVNSMADRTFNDLTQYPVFPWIISDYSSPTLDLSNSSSFRDLTKPIGALNPERLTRLKSRFSEMASPKFLYGSHYSTPGFVLFYLVRKYPHYMLCLQNGRFDHPDRMFNSVSDTWKNVLTNMSDFKELVPEFYDTSCRGEFLKNLYGVNFGCKYDGSKVNDVQLPPWGETPEDFVHKLRTALESNYVSSHLHEWIDLIFGYKQRGDEALKADNKFYYLCYEGAIDLDSIKDWNQRHAVEVQIMEFGQIPRQVFKQPHPARICLTLELENRFARSVENTDDFVNNDTNYHIEHYWKWDIIQSEASFCFQSHKEEITDIAVSHDSSIMFSVSRDGLFKMFDIIDFKQERSLSFSRTALTSIILLEDNDTAIIGCWDSSILVYNIECGSIIDKVVIHEDAVNCLGWCKKTKRLISASFDCSIRVWKANIPWNTLKLSSSLLAQLHHDTKIPCLTICSNEKLMASGSENGVIYIWSLKTYKIAFRLNGHEKQVTDMKFSYRAERLISCSQDHSFRVFDLSTGSQVYYKYLDQEINSILWDDCHVVLGGNLGTLFVWNLVKNTLINQIQAHAGGVTTISYSKDGSVIITGGRDGKIYIWTTFNYNI